MVSYRVCRRIYARLDGEGARKVGGRWNSPGRAVVYMAQSVALAVLENLVHMSRRDYPTGYVIVEARVPDHILILEYDRFLVWRLDNWGVRWDVANLVAHASGSDSRLIQN